MSFSYVKRKLSKPEVVQIGQHNLATHHTLLNKTQQLENQVTFSSGYSLLVIAALIIVFIGVVVLFAKKRSKVSQ